MYIEIYIYTFIFYYCLVCLKIGKVFKTLISSLPTRINKQPINRQIKHLVLNLKLKLNNKLFYYNQFKIN